MIRQVKVVPYDPDWPRSFRAEANELEAIFGQEVVAIHHIGSTAIPNMSAKPIIDILMEVKQMKQELARQFPADIEGYMAGKDGLVKEIDRKAKAWKGEARQATS